MNEEQKQAYLEQYKQEKEEGVRGKAKEPAVKPEERETKVKISPLARKLAKVQFRLMKRLILLFKLPKA